MEELGLLEKTCWGGGESLRDNHCRIRVAAKSCSNTVAIKSEYIVSIWLDNLNMITPWD